MLKILVTGAGGFVGRAVIERLRRESAFIRCAVRESISCYPFKGLEDVVVGCVSEETDWSEALTNVDVIIHLVARTHLVNEGPDKLPLYRSVNVGGTLSLAQQAVRAGASRIIFVSSIKVNGEKTFDKPFTEADIPAPGDAYGISKLEAEEALISTLEGTGVEYTIVRPPLIYGPGVKANLLSLTRAVLKGVPLPLGSLTNKRSLLGVKNLADFLVCCISDPNAAQKTFLLSDGEDISTPDLVRLIAESAGVSPKLLPCPVRLLRLGGEALARSSMVDKLVDSLQIDSSLARRALNWNPPFTLREELMNMVKALK